MPTPITTEAMVDQLFDLWVAQGVTFDDLTAAKAAAVPIFQNWLGGDNALPAETMRTALNVLGRQNSFVLNQYEVWTTPADGGPNEDGTVNVLLPDGTSEAVPGWKKIIDATQKGNAGWSPVLVTAADGPTRVVLQVTDWTGGEGSKPATGVYLGATGFVADIAEAVDIFAAITAHLTTFASAAASARDSAVIARSDAQEFAGAVRDVVDADIILDRLFPFVAKAASGPGRKLLMSADPADGAWKMLLEGLSVRGGMRLQLVETNEVSGIYFLAPDPTGKLKVLDRWPKEPAPTISVEAVETADGGAGGFMVLSGNRKILFKEDKDTPIEVAAARGAKSSLAARLAPTLNSLGLPLEPDYGKWLLYQTHARLAALKSGLGDSVQLDIGLWGDSFTDNAERYTTALTNRLVDEFGDAGGGWVGFTPFSWDGTTALYLRGNARPTLYTCALSGGWTVNRYGSYGPDFGKITSSAAGSKVTLTGPITGAPALSGIKLFAEGSSDGVVRYRWNGGTWTALSLQPAGPFTADLSIAPGAGSSWVLEIEVVSGSCNLCGANLLSNNPGVRVHKLAAAGGHLYDFVAVNQSNWVTMAAQLNVHVGSMMVLTNDQSAARTVTQVTTDMATWLARLQLAAPNADRAIIMPPENNRTTNAVAMKEYAAAVYPLAVAHGVAYMDLQYHFGPDPTKYAHGSGRPWMDDDLVHPTPATGGRAIAGALYSFFKP